MKCAVHVEREAIGACCSCGSYVCQECKASIEGQIYCNRCVQVRLKTGGWPGQTRIVEPYASGLGSGTPVPPEAKRWSWGGFLLTWIWGIGNNVWISLLALLSIIPWVGWIAGLTMRIILGVRGNEWAWQRKKWDSIEHFEQVQRRWMRWGIAGIAAYIMLVISVAVLAVAIVMLVNAMGYESDLETLIPWN